MLFHKVIHSISISLLSANRNGKQVDSVTDQSHNNQPVADKDSTSTLNVNYVMQWVQHVNNKLILYKYTTLRLVVCVKVCVHDR